MTIGVCVQTHTHTHTHIKFPRSGEFQGVQLHREESRKWMEINCHR